MHETVSGSTASTSAERAHLPDGCCTRYYCDTESTVAFRGVAQQTRTPRRGAWTQLHKGGNAECGRCWSTHCRYCCRSRVADTTEPIRGVGDDGEQVITSAPASSSTTSPSSPSLSWIASLGGSTGAVPRTTSSYQKSVVDDGRPSAAADVVVQGSSTIADDWRSLPTETTMMSRRRHCPKRRPLPTSSGLCAEEKRRRPRRTTSEQPLLQQRRRSLTTALATSTVLDGLLLLALLATFPHAVAVANGNHAQTASTASGRCYSLGPGITIHGAEYRRDYGTERKICAEVCQYDSCCMAYEWQKEEGMCTLKSRSLNGSVVRTSATTFFGLCLDYSDAERDRFWDHVITGPLVGSVSGTARGKCADICADGDAASFDAAPPPVSERVRHRKRAPAPAPALIYNWRSDDARDADAELGTCECVAVLQSVRLSFGSFSGFLV